MLLFALTVLLMFASPVVPVYKIPPPIIHGPIDDPPPNDDEPTPPRPDIEECNGK